MCNSGDAKVFLQNVFSRNSDKACVLNELYFNFMVAMAPDAQNKHSEIQWQQNYPILAQCCISYRNE